MTTIKTIETKLKTLCNEFDDDLTHGYYLQCQEILKDLQALREGMPDGLEEALIIGNHHGGYTFDPNKMATIYRSASYLQIIMGE